MINPFSRAQARLLVESPLVQKGIIALIVINAITLGLDTSSTARDSIGGLLGISETTTLAVFIAELTVKLYAYRLRFFRNPWNFLDLFVISISLVATGPYTVLRTLRIIRVLVLLTKFDKLKAIIKSFLVALPSIGWVALLLAIVFYVYAVIGTGLFSESFPEYFGHLGKSLYTLFQIMTLESWSHGISRPVLEVYPYAWIYFVSFVALSAFIALNLFIGIIVSAVQDQHQEGEAKGKVSDEEIKEAISMIKDLHDKLGQ